MWFLGVEGKGSKEWPLMGTGFLELVVMVAQLFKYIKRHWLDCTLKRVNCVVCELHLKKPTKKIQTTKRKVETIEIPNHLISVVQTYEWWNCSKLIVVMSVELWDCIKTIVCFKCEFYGMLVYISINLQNIMN